MTVTTEFDRGDRSEIELLRGSVEDSLDQLRRARRKLDRAQRRVKNLEVASESWSQLLAQYERAVQHGRAPVTPRPHLHLIQPSPLGSGTGAEPARSVAAVSLPRSLRCAALAGLVLIVAAGCSSSDSDDSGSSTTKPAGQALTATGWVLDRSTDLGLAHSTVAVTAEFGDGRIAGNGGCNDYTAPYKVSGTKVTIGPNIASTSMACEAGPTAVEAAYLRRLPQVESFAVDGSLLTLSGGNGEPLLVYHASTTTDALSGEWNATSIYTGTAVQSVLDGSPPTARFDRGQVTGDSSCNNFSGGYEVHGKAITMGPFSSTMMACVDPARQTQEQQYLAALELAKTFRVTGDRLDLERADGGIAVTFERGSATG